MSRKIYPEIKEKVRLRSRYLCEYCHANERRQCVEFTIDHIYPDGGDDLDNLALACFHCNRRKSDKTEVFDSSTGRYIRLFHPRVDKWRDHFEWSEDGILIIPKSPIGSATSDLLNLNRPRILRIREADVSVDRHPPLDDR